MLASSASAILLRPSAKVADERPSLDLEIALPRAFGDWREESKIPLLVVNPQGQELVDKLYSQVVNRSYVNPQGYRIMVAVAYGSNQRGALQAHKPEVCYPAQGFTLHSNEPAALPTPFGDLAIRRLSTSIQSRVEPITYWFTVGDTTVTSRTHKRLVDLRFGLTGRIPDGLLFRVSSIDADVDRAHRMQATFVNQLVASLTPESRLRLSGLQGPFPQAGQQ